MLSKTLLKKTVKDNKKMWLTITLILSGMLTIFIMASNAMASRNPHMAEQGGGMLSNFYSSLAIFLPLIYIIMTANKLVAAQVDKGSLAYVMSGPMKRNKFSISQAFFLLTSVAAMFFTITVVGILAILISGGSIEIGSFILLNVGAFLFHAAISGISYLSSCIFNRSSKSLVFGAGIPIAFFLFSTLAEMDSLIKGFKLFKYITINTLFSFSDIMAYSTNMIWQFSILAIIAAVCYTVGVMYFKKKDLPL